MTVTDVRTSQYLTGNFAPVREEVDVQDLPVDGEIPHDLEGRLLRIGPNPVRAGAEVRFVQAGGAPSEVRIFDQNGRPQYLVDEDVSPMREVY